MASIDKMQKQAETAAQELQDEHGEDWQEYIGDYHEDIYEYTRAVVEMVATFTPGDGDDKKVLACLMLGLDPVDFI